MLEFKYQTELNRLFENKLELPPLDVPQNKLAYRYVFDYEHPNNHKPIYIQNPKRKLSHADKDMLTTSGYALSCFEEEKLAVQKFKNLKNTHKNIGSSIGNALCIGFLDEKDGLITETNKNNDTHFDLYEYVECDLNSKFDIKKRLV
jgi:hypothetical protein